GFPFLGLAWFMLTGFFLLGLINERPFRQRVKHQAIEAWRGTRSLVIDVPLRLLPLPTLRRMVQSWTLQLIYWYVLKPLVVCLLLWWLYPPAVGTLVRFVGVFLAANFLLNSHVGMAAGELVARGLWLFWRRLKDGLLMNLFRLIVWLFKQVTDLVEYVLYSVDEWLRFLTRSSRVSIAV